MNGYSNKKSMIEKQKNMMEIIKRIPDCCNKRVVLMPSNTCCDIKEMKNQNKINNNTFCLIVDNLKSEDLKKYCNKSSFFKRELKKKLYDIFKDNSFYEHNKNYCKLDKNIEDIRFDRFNIKDGFDFIFADTCQKYNDKLIKWITCDLTINYLHQNGIICFTITLDRYNIEEIHESIKDFKMKGNPEILIKSNDYKRANFLLSVASKIEQDSNYQLETVFMSIYQEKGRQKMANIMFKKK